MDFETDEQLQKLEQRIKDLEDWKDYVQKACYHKESKLITNGEGKCANQCLFCGAIYPQLGSDQLWS